MDCTTHNAQTFAGRLNTRPLITGMALALALGLAGTTQQAAQARTAAPGTAPGEGGPSLPQLLVLPRIGTFQFTATWLHAVDAQEDSWYSDGDEPWVIWAVIHPTSGGPAVYYQRSDVYSGIDGGDWIDTSWRLPDKVTGSDLGVVALAVEHDSSSVSGVYGEAKIAANTALLLAKDEGVCAATRAVAEGLRDGINSYDRVGIDDDDVLWGEGYGSPSRCFRAKELFSMGVGSKRDFAVEYGAPGTWYQQEFVLQRR